MPFSEGPGFKSNIELQLEVGFVTTDLKWFHRNDRRIVENADEFIAANAQFAFARLDFVVLHPAGFIGYCAVNPFALHSDRGGDVPHKVQ